MYHSSHSLLEETLTSRGTYVKNMSLDNCIFKNLNSLSLNSSTSQLTPANVKAGVNHVQWALLFVSQRAHASLKAFLGD